MEATWRVQHRGGGSRQHVGNGPIMLGTRLDVGVTAQRVHRDKIDVIT
jgi:hypothetical protein